MRTRKYAGVKLCCSNRKKGERNTAKQLVMGEVNIDMDIMEEYVHMPEIVGAKVKLPPSWVHNNRTPCTCRNRFNVAPNIQRKKVKRKLEILFLYTISRMCGKVEVGFANEDEAFKHSTLLSGDQWVLLTTFLGEVMQV